MTQTTLTAHTVPADKLIASYARSSSHDGGTSYLQTAAIGGYSRNTFGRLPDLTFEDRRVGIAGRSRLALQTLKAAIESGTVGVVIVIDIDRIARTLTALNDFKSLCHRMGVELHTCSSMRQELQRGLDNSFRSYLALERANLHKARAAHGRARAKAAKKSAA